MAKIKGRFAPLTDELGYDDRFKLELTDFERLMYLLIIHTTHMTRHQAPQNPQYYKLQYGLNARKSQIEHAINTLKGVFPKLRTSEGKLSLINSTTYENQKCLEEEVEEEEEREEERKPKISTSPFFESFKKLCPSLPEPKALSKQRKLKIKQRLRDRDLAAWQDVFRRMESSAFLKGGNDRGWKASFDWIIANEDNALKVLEGKYDNQTFD